MIQQIHHLVREAVDLHLSLNVEDSDLSVSDFQSIFKQYIKEAS